MAKKKITLVDEIDALEQRVESALDKLAEKKRPANVPAPWMRQNWMGKANGNVFAAFKIAAKEGT